MKKIFYFIVFIFSLKLSSQLKPCEDNTLIIYNNIINNIANNFPPPPEIKITKTRNNPAYISKGIIHIDTRLINCFCDKENFESKINQAEKTLSNIRGYL